MREYGLPLTHIYLYIDRIYDSVLTRKNKSQQKPKSRTTPWSTNVSEISHTVKDQFLSTFYMAAKSNQNRFAILNILLFQEQMQVWLTLACILEICYSGKLLFYLLNFCLLFSFHSIYLMFCICKQLLLGFFTELVV